MPALPTIANTWLVNQHYNTDTVELHEMDTVHCVHADATDYTAVTLATAFAAQLAAHIMPFIPVEIILGSTAVLPLDGISSETVTTTASAGTLGGHNSGVFMGTAYSTLTTWRSGIRGKSKRGRTYWPGVNTDMLVNPEARLLTFTARTAIANGSEAFRSGLLGLASPVVLKVLSRKLGTAVDVLSVSANTGACIQRRRWERVPHH